MRLFGTVAVTTAILLTAFSAASAASLTTAEAANLDFSNGEVHRG